MEIIKGFLRKNRIQIVIHSIILLMSFVFADVSIFIGYQLHSFVGILIIGLTAIYLYMIMSTVLKLQVMTDKSIWKSLFNYGLLVHEQHKISAVTDICFIILSLPISVILSNYIINKQVNRKGIYSSVDFICILIEIVLFAVAYKRQNHFILYMFEENHGEPDVRIYEKLPLSMKNVLRNSDKMEFVAGIICVGVIACNGILFMLNCDNSEVYINNAITVDYFLTEHKSRNSIMRTEDEIVKESDIEEVRENDYFKAGGRLYHSLDEKRAELITNQLPETSKFPLLMNRAFETNEKGNYFVNLYGADEFVFLQMELYEGEIDYEKLASGKYIIYGLEKNPGNIAYMGEISEEWKYFQVGDKVTLNGAAGLKTYEVMATCIVNHTYSEEHSYSYAGHELVFYLPTKEYLSYGDENAMRYLFCTVNSQIIDDDLKNIGFESRRGLLEEYLGEEKAIRNSAIIFAFGCVGVGFFAYFNILIVSYLDRKKEFQILENIGMTSGQLQVMVLGEGILYGIIISVISIASSVLIEFIGKQVLIGEYWFFTWTFKPLMICVALVLIISVVVPISVYKCMVKS